MTTNQPATVTVDGETYTEEATQQVELLCALPNESFHENDFTEALHEGLIERTGWFMHPFAITAKGRRVLAAVREQE